MGLTDITNSRETLKLITLEYSIESEGNFRDEPIIELFCRDAHGERRIVKVEGFYPSFYITEEEYLQYEDDLLQESSVRSIEVSEDILSEESKMNGAVTPVESAPRQRLDKEKCVRIYTVKPSQVSDLRETFDWHGEADVFFTNRFLIDSGIDRGLSVPLGEECVDYDEIEPVDEERVPDIAPRMHTVDIEVWSGGEFPDTQNPQKPITAISAHDSYSDEYFCAVLHPSAISVGDSHSWDEKNLEVELTDSERKQLTSEDIEELEDELDWEDDVSVYHNENQMLADYFSFVDETDPDLLTGWNSSANDIGSGFDYPYLVNRAENINERSVYSMTYENGSVFVSNRGSAYIGGREMFDMLQAYKKTQIHEKRSYSLEYIAQEELGQGKEDIADLDEGWLHEPVQFMKYNLRDVDAVVEIEKSKKVLEMYDHIRSITGATYSDIADSNIGIIDLLFLRQATEKGYALPTSERPDVQHYWGAYVFPPQAGKHNNVVYPDLKSLYPNLFRDMNASPETIIGDESDLRDSEYTKDECQKIYVDPRDEDVKKSADEPERKTLYVLKPEVKESFVREIVEDLIDMKYEYKKDEYSDEAYGAVKRITNSVYGVMGDSVSYGKGFRLFDWRIAEAITLAGRDVIKHTADKFETRVKSMGYRDAEIVAGDTDSCVCKIPTADGIDETLNVAQEAAKYVDSTYPEFMDERFGIEDGNMAVEIESYSQSALFMDAKKRYSQLVRWDEGDYVDEVEYKGFKLVRSDSADVTTVVQKGVLERILRNDEPKDSVESFLKEKYDAVLNGEASAESVGTPSSISSDPMDYGWSIDDDTGEVKYFTPQPHIRGARYATAYIDGEDITAGSKPLMFYVNGVHPSSDLPETYQYEDRFSLNAPQDKPDANTREMKEIDREVDAIAVEDVRNIPDEITINWEKMAEKTIEDAVTNIAITMGWDFSDLVADGSQMGLGQYM